MIVMKFGGSSLASACAIRRVISIIRSEVARRPVVVASAVGDTTDILIDVLSAAKKADSFSCRKLQDKISDQHFEICEELVHGSEQGSLDRYLRDTFRDLRVRTSEICDGERQVTPELQDWVLSLGEQISSRILAAVLQQHIGKTVHFDSRELILTDTDFTNAKPRYWETYARIRWTVPIAARDSLVVMGGFIGSTEAGQTTTLGRGGSDLTASILGAAVNADEIQVWKDVNGMLTCDPRLRQDACQVKSLSYEEATELANAGATILHPETMLPAKRLRIPIVIRNTFCPSAEGTRIESKFTRSSTLVKSVAVKSNVTLLEVRCNNQPDDLGPLVSFCKEHSSAATVLCSSENTLYVAMDENAKIPEESRVPTRCLNVRIRTGQALFTLVGQLPDRETVSKQLTAALNGIAAFIIPSADSPYSIKFVLPQKDLKKGLDLIHQSFFSNSDPKFFAVSGANQTRKAPAAPVLQKREQQQRSFVPSTKFLVPN